MAEMRSIEGALFTTNEGVLWGEYRMDNSGEGVTSGWNSAFTCSDSVEESMRYQECGSTRYNNWSTWELPNYEECETMGELHPERWRIHQFPSGSYYIPRCSESCDGNDFTRSVEARSDKETSGMVCEQQTEIGGLLLCAELVEGENEGRSTLESMPTCESVIGARYSNSIVAEQKLIKGKKAQTKTTLDLWTTQLWKKHAFDGVRWKIKSIMDAEGGRFYGYVGRWKLRPSCVRRIPRTKEIDVYERVSRRCTAMSKGERKPENEKAEYTCNNL